MTRVLLVTGGGRGIGAAVSTLAARAGYAVAVNYRTDNDAAQATVDHILEQGGQAIAVAADVTDEGQVGAVFDTAERVLGPVTALVNNAGWTGPAKRLADQTIADIRRVIDVNLLGVVIPAREAIRRMSTRRGGAGGAIVNLSSGAATIGSAGEFVHYAAAKAAVDALTLGLAREVADEGIRVNAVAPGVVDTRMHADGGLPNKARKLGAAVPIGRCAEVEDIARPVLWLLSEEASYTTGAVLRVAGER